MKCNYCLSTVGLVQNNKNVHETTRDTRQRRVIWSLLNTNIHADEEPNSTTHARCVNASGLGVT